MLILDKYQIIEEVGRGGMGLVYKAQDLKLGRIVAIKELIINESIKGVERQNIISRFQREAQTGASLNHPNIVTIYDFGEDNNRHFIAMEFLKGKDLKEYINEKYQFAYDDLLNIFIQIADALAHAHSMKITHRDIKPANIQVIQKNKIKITDFGLAKHSEISSELTQDGQMFGTLGYISPEQLISAKNADSRADIFSFGVMMYEVITKKLPFEGDNIGATIYKILSAEPPPISELVSHVPVELEKIIYKTLQKDPAQRYQTANEIIEELMKCREHSGIRENQIIISGFKDEEKQDLVTANISELKTEVIKIPEDKLSVNNTSHGLKSEKLQRGQKLSLEELFQSKKLSFCINWLSEEKLDSQIECCALLLSKNEKLEEDENFVFYNNLFSLCKGIKLDKSDNQFFKSLFEIDLDKISPDVSRIKFILTIDNPVKTVRNINNLITTLIGPSDKSLAFKIEDLSDEVTVELSELYLHNGKWKYHVKAEGFKKNLSQYLKMYITDKIDIYED